VSGLVGFRLEQISAVTDPGWEHFWSDRMKTTVSVESSHDAGETWRSV